jgi:hypothetical protein
MSVRGGWICSTLGNSPRAADPAQFGRYQKMRAYRSAAALKAARSRRRVVADAATEAAKAKEKEAVPEGTGTMGTGTGTMTASKGWGRRRWSDRRTLARAAVSGSPFNIASQTRTKGLQGDGFSSPVRFPNAET